MKKVGNQYQQTIYVSPEQAKALKKLSHTTKIPETVIIREGVDLVLKKYKGKK